MQNEAKAVPILPKGQTSMTVALTYILISVLLGATGQLLLKHGMSIIGEVTLSPGAIGPVLWRMGTNLFVMGGLMLYVLDLVFWLAALSRVQLSYAYPFVGLSYVVMLLASWQLFNEQISPLRIAGTLVVGLGIILISRS
jgi:drug/metabolite transporter (DMT)-like permease